MQYKYNTTAIQCCNTSFLQLAENLQATCRSCKKTCIAAVLRLRKLLQYNKIFVLFYCSCIVVVLHLCGSLYPYKTAQAQTGIFIHSHMHTLQWMIFARDSIYAKRAYAIAIPSVRPSVTRVDQSKTVEVRIIQFSPYRSPIPLVFVR